jgi:hypothetical protein
MGNRLVTQIYIIVRRDAAQRFYVSGKAEEYALGERKEEVD